MSEASEIAENMIRRAGKPAVADITEAREWVAAQWPDWRDWVSLQQFDNIAESVLRRSA